MKTLLIALFVTASCFAQEAKIMIVEKPDSQRLARAYREYQDALKHWEEVKGAVAKQYTTQDGKVVAGWEKVQFSADFRAIVPESSQYAGRACWGYGASILTNTSSTTPLTGLTTGTGTNSNAVLTYNGPDNTVQWTELGVDQTLKTQEAR